MEQFNSILPRAFAHDQLMTNAQLAIELGIFIWILDKMALNPFQDLQNDPIPRLGKCRVTIEELKHGVMAADEIKSGGSSRIYRALNFLECECYISRENHGRNGTIVTIPDYETVYGPAAYGKGNYVSLPRGMSRFEWFTDKNVRRMYLYLLMSVGIKRHMANTTYYHGFLDAGDVIWGSTSWAKRMGTTPYFVKKWLKILEKSGAISVIPKPNVGTIVHVWGSVNTNGNCFAWNPRFTELCAPKRTEEEDEKALTSACVSRTLESYDQFFLRRKKYWERLSREQWGNSSAFQKEI